MTFGSTQLTPYADRTSVGQRYAHYHPYQHDSEPDSYYRQAPILVPRPLPTVALRLQDPRLRCERNLGWSIDWAVAFIIDRLQKNSPDAAEQLKGIRIRAANLERDGHSKDIAYRIFNRLDETLFAGHLKDAIFVDIKHLGTEVSGATHSQGWSLDPKVKRASIILNGDLLQHARSRDIVAILLHHMIHAYFLIACGPQDQKETEYGRLGHGLHFGKIMMMIRELTAVHGKPLPALNFGHTLSEYPLFHDEYHHPKRRSYSQRGQDKWYCSHCSSDVDGIADGDINKWYASVCEPLLELPENLRNSTVHVYNDRRHEVEQVLRAQTVPSTASVEFIVNERSILVPKAHIDDYVSIYRAFEKAGSRYLKVHEVVSADTFERFLELLYTGSYGPNASLLQCAGLQGPPVIKSPTGSEPYMMTDIRIFKMGVVMGFEEVKAIALDRMYRRSITYEDPVALLKEIYNGGEPDSDLKQWVRKFLTRTPTAVEGVYPYEPPNLAKLEADLLGFKFAFLELLQNSSALKYEVVQARRELMQANARLRAGPTCMDVSLGREIPRELSPPLGYGYPVPLAAIPTRSGEGILWRGPHPGAGKYLGYPGFDDERWEG
jgi:hypothetical protein